MTELYTLATLVYLERISSNAIAELEKISRCIDRAFHIMGQLEACPWPFVLLIFGLEARTEDERMTVLKSITESGKRTCLTNFSCMKNMLRFAWVQDDLGTAHITYVEKINIVFSTNRTLPAFI